MKQGCPLSPTLFGIYIDDFQAELEAAGGDLDLPTLCGVQAPALFYADDLDLVSTSVRGLQAQLELLESFCTRWRLTVNVKKTKVEWIAARKLQIAMEMRTFDRKAVCVLRFSTTYIHKPWRADCRSNHLHRVGWVGPTRN